MEQNEPPETNALKRQRSKVISIETCGYVEKKKEEKAYEKDAKQRVEVRTTVRQNEE